MEVILTGHARRRLFKRKILEEELLDIIHYPGRIMKKHGKYFYQKKIQRGTVEVVCERTEKHIKVITLYWL